MSEFMITHHSTLGFRHIFVSYYQIQPSPTSSIQYLHARFCESFFFIRNFYFVNFFFQLFEGCL